MAEKSTKSVATLPILFFDGDKGGVGKSSACAAFADWAHAQRLPIAIVDGDARNADVSRIFDGVVPVRLANLRTHDGWMDLTDFVFEHGDRMILVSMPAGVGAEMKEEAPRLLAMLKEAEHRTLSLVWVINRTLDSINLLNPVLELLGAHLKGKVVLKNLFFGTEDKFRRWDDSKTRERFKEAGGIDLPFHELHERTMDKLFADQENLMPFSSASVPIKQIQESPHKLTPSEAVELRTWLDANAKTFAAAAQVMGIEVK